MNALLSIRDYRHTLILTSLSVVLVISILFSLTIGAVSIPVKEVSILLLQKIGLFSSIEIDSTYNVVLNAIRIPRIMMTLLIGASLGVSGAALQGLFRNPLVEPSLIGVSSGSAAAVVLVIVFGSVVIPATGFLHDTVISFSAFVGGLIATFLVLKLSNQNFKTNIAVLVLIGVAVNAFANAIIGLAIFHANENQLRTFTFWTLGDLGGATWEKLFIAAPLLLLSCIVLLFHSHNLNALSLGEAEAFHIGVDTERTKRLIIFFSALAVGVSVSLAGMIGFIGLVVPHVVRVSFFTDNKLVLPASLLGGALLLLISDVIARVVVRPSELPIGVVTAFIGAPFFMALLMKAKNKNEI